MTFFRLSNLMLKRLKWRHRDKQVSCNQGRERKNSIKAGTYDLAIQGNDITWNLDGRRILPRHRKKMLLHTLAANPLRNRWLAYFLYASFLPYRFRLDCGHGQSNIPLKELRFFRLFHQPQSKAIHAEIDDGYHRSSVVS